MVEQHEQRSILGPTVRVGELMQMIRSWALVSMSAVAACVPANAPPPVTPPPAAPKSMEQTYDATPKDPLVWSTFDAQTFARAKAEGKFVVMDGSAEWCHWCHVMEAVTYHDPKVAEILKAHFIAAKVDVDARPDIEERYADYGWPATVIFSPDARELGKFRGFITPEDFSDILQKVVSSAGKAGDARVRVPPIADTPMSEEQLSWIARITEFELEDYWDAEQGGWGKQQKVAIPSNNAWLIARARGGDATAKDRLALVLEKQRAIIDPVWGGIYQYSTDGDWVHPHFEKLMFYNAGAIDNYAEAYELTKDPKWLAAANALRGYVSRFLKGPSGGFFATQDADLNAHEQGKTFLIGHEYYDKPEAARLALGVPRVDTHEYARENGLAMRAYCTFAHATKDSTALDEASRAADRVLATHADGRGGVTHDVPTADAPARLLHLADNASFAWGLLGIWEATQSNARLAQAIKIVDFILGNLQDEQGGGFFANTVDDAAVGIFAERRKPFEDNVTMLRVLARLSRANREKSAIYGRAIDRTLRAIATPDAIKDRGRFVGDFLLALEETKGVRGGAH